MNFIMPVGILTFISMIYTTSERLKARNISIFQCNLAFISVEISFSVEPGSFCVKRPWFNGA